MNKNIHIIGSGFSALASSCYLAKQGYSVTVLEKNDTLGGRARQFKKDGFTFDIGPSWYWMPDVFERFFADFGKKPSDYYTLDKLSPGYEVYFGEKSSLKISENLEDIYKMFEEEEKGSAKHLKSFLDSAKSNYDTAIKDLVYKDDRKILVLSDRREHLKEFKRILDEDLSITFTYGLFLGQMKQADLQRSRSSKVILATFSAFGEGVSEKDLDTLILTTPKKFIGHLIAPLKIY